MDQHSATLLSADQLRESPAVHLATGMIAVLHDVSCAEAFELLDEKAIDDGSLSAAAQNVIRRGATASGGGAPVPGPRSTAARRERWAIQDAGDLQGDEASERR